MSTERTITITLPESKWWSMEWACNEGRAFVMMMGLNSTHRDEVATELGKAQHLLHTVLTESKK